jgi:malonate transporter and related proteins
MVLKSLFPVFALICLGALLKRRGITNDAFLSTSDRLIYFIFFPALLFWKIGGGSQSDLDLGLCWAGLLAVLGVYLLSTSFILLRPVGTYQAGAFSQACYRFNTYAGVAIVMNAMGEAGLRHFGLLIGFVIPFINVLAVTTLVWFSGERMAPGKQLTMTLKAVVSNPLILACLGGLGYSRLGIGFAPFIDNTLALGASVTLPLALLSIGGALTFASVRDYLSLTIWAALFKLLLLPIVGYFCLRLFQVQALPLRVGMIFFSLPTSTALYVLSAQLGSDTRYASAAIVSSTILSFIPLTIVLTSF